MFIQALLYNIANLLSLYTAVGFFILLQVLKYYDIKKD